MSSGDLLSPGRVKGLVESRLLHSLLGRVDEGSTKVLTQGRLARDVPAWWSGFKDGVTSVSCFFISSFFFRKAWISSSFLRFISTISLCKDINNVIFSASDIFSLAMFLIDTICSSLLSNSLGPAMGANCSRLKGDWENYYLLPSIGRSLFLLHSTHQFLLHLVNLWSFTSVNSFLCVGSQSRWHLQKVLQWSRKYLLFSVRYN